MASANQVRRPSADTTAIVNILSPGRVEVNVQGAFIVTEEASDPRVDAADGAKHDTDIRLPNHRGVVSHVALDVGLTMQKQADTDMLLLCRLVARSLSLSTFRVNLEPERLAALCTS